jgi:sensor histidine kinase regulating citrate/malate metabolism
MVGDFPRQIEMKIDEARYWEGLGRQEMDFHQVLGELIDNSISASGFDTDGDLVPFTIEITIQHIGNRVKVKVADQGIGMSLNDL